MDTRENSARKDKKEIRPKTAMPGSWEIKHREKLHSSIFPLFSLVCLSGRFILPLSNFLCLLMLSDPAEAEIHFLKRDKQQMWTLCGYSVVSKCLLRVKRRLLYLAEVVECFSYFVYDFLSPLYRKLHSEAGDGLG